MKEPSLRIFISYPRADARGYAGSLAYCLEERYGDENVFRDVEAIDAGIDYMQLIEKELSQTDVILCLIGEQWATIPDSEGVPRLHDPEDPVRQESASVLGKKKAVIPILLEGAANSRG